MGDLAIRASGLSKRYAIWTRRARHDTLREHLTSVMGRALQWRGRSREEKKTLWALRDVSFEIRQGEAVGIIGRNGAGKSTLLKILSRITEPTAGDAELLGRVGSLLEVGTGFHAELTGRENIYLNGAVLGMKKSEIDRRRDDIVAFAGVEEFIDTPVKRYSSGMYLRLAFAVAAHLQPEILLVDEVLAVGDAEFQKKCLGKMGDVVKAGRTVVFISHNMGAIAQLCERALWIHDGELKLDGPASTVVAAYLSSTMPDRSVWVNPTFDPFGQAKFQFKSARVLSPENQPVSITEYDRPYQIETRYVLGSPLKDLAIICRMTDAIGNIIWTSWDSDEIGWKSGRVRPAGEYVSTCVVPARLLRPGAYQVLLGAFSAETAFFGLENVLTFEISDVGYPLNLDRQGIITPILRWEIGPAGADAAQAERDVSSVATFKQR
jgi:lipopolysaccharide transport system ATP-binding protein